MVRMTWERAFWSVVGILTAAMFLTGCSLSPSADFIEALGKDPATVSVRVNTIYGTIMFCRTAILNGDVACNGDGISVRSQNQSVSVPVLVQPGFQLTPSTGTH